MGKQSRGSRTWEKRTYEKKDEEGKPRWGGSTGHVDPMPSLTIVRRVISKERPRSLRNRVDMWYKDKKRNNSKTDYSFNPTDQDCLNTL